MLLTCASLFTSASNAVTGKTVSVGPPFFNATFLPLAIPLVAALGVGAMLAWKRGNITAAASAAEMDRVHMVRLLDRYGLRRKREI